MRVQDAHESLRVGGTIGLIALIVLLFSFFVDVHAVLVQLRRIDWYYGLAASAMLIIGLLTYARRWRMLLADKVAFPNTFHTANVGHMLNMWIPFRAGEPARILLLGQSQAVPLSEVTSSVVVERWLEQVMRLAALGGAIVFGVGLEVSAETMLGVLAFSGISLAGMMGLVKYRVTILDRWPLWLGRLPRVTEASARRILAGLLDGFATVASTRRLVIAFSWSVITWICFLGFHYLVLLALATDFQPEQALALSLGSLALAPPSAATQPGLYHASIVAPLSLVGYSTELLATYAIVLHALQMMWISSLGIWGLYRARTSFRELLTAQTEKRSEAPSPGAN